MERMQAVEDVAGRRLVGLPRWADKALIGFAERAGADGRIVSAACYGYQAMKAVLREMDERPDGMYRTLASARFTPGILVLYKYAKSALWSTVQARGLHRWELLDSALLGVGEMSGVPDAVVYSTPISTNVLAAAQRWSDEGAAGGTTPSLHALRMLENTVLPVHIGPDTPWFLTPVS